MSVYQSSHSLPVILAGALCTFLSVCVLIVFHIVFHPMSMFDTWVVLYLAVLLRSWDAQKRHLQATAIKTTRRVRVIAHLLDVLWPVVLAWYLIACLGFLHYLGVMNIGTVAALLFVSWLAVGRIAILVHRIGRT
jgi:hypothetical protein